MAESGKCGPDPAVADQSSGRPIEIEDREVTSAKE
jgi:hypothetical protein